MEDWLELSGISRFYGAIHALDGASLRVRKGEIMGLVGENGAGKSTMVKIISGFDSGYAGSFKVDGQEVKLSGPDDAQQLGIAIAQQELSLIATMSVAENIFLAGLHVPTVATPNRLAQLALPFLEEVGLGEIDPHIQLSHLSVGERHLVEVARLISHSPQLLILDEPTAALGESDSQRIIKMVRRLADAGKSIVYVSHRLDEIFQLTDRVTILRDGKSHDPVPTSELSVESLVERMLGRELEEMFPPRPVRTDRKVLLEVKDLWPDQVLQPVSFSIRAGEILGLAGQLGSGAGEVLAALVGDHPCRSGTIVGAGGERYLPRSPRGAIARHMGYCSSDRKKDGLFLGRPILENLTAPALETISRLGLRLPALERVRAAQLARDFTVDVARLPDEAGVLSGGNQQKVALGKWLSIAPQVLLVNEPTRGVDVGARAEIYRKLREIADQGTAVVIASTDLYEIVNLPDRLYCFYKGLLVDEREGEDIEMTAVLTQITEPFGDLEAQRVLQAAA